MDAVIVTHNSAADLRAQVASHATLESFDRLLVVDNASTDNTREVAADAGLGSFRWRPTGSLAAAASGCGQGVGPSFALLNPDVRVTSASASGAWRRLAEDGVVRWRRLSSCPTGLCRTPRAGSRTRSTCWFAGSRAETAVRWSDKTVDVGATAVPGDPPGQLIGRRLRRGATSSISRTWTYASGSELPVSGSLRPDRSRAS
jgi:hypothetical protein